MKDFQFCGSRYQSTNPQNLKYRILPGCTEFLIKHTPANLTVEGTLNGNCTAKQTIQLPKYQGTFNFCLSWTQENNSLQIMYGNETYSICENSTSPQKCQSFQQGQRKSWSCSKTSCLYNVSCSSVSELQSSGVFYRFYGSCDDCGCNKAKTSMLNSNSQQGRTAEAALNIANRLVAHCTLMNSSDLHRIPFVLESKLLKQPFSETQKTYDQPNVKATVFKTNTENFTGLEFNCSSPRETNAVPSEKSCTISLPPSLLEMAPRKDKALRILAMCYRKQTFFQDEKRSKVLRETVLGVTVERLNISNLSKPVTLTFRHDQLQENVNHKYTCVFWDTTAKDYSVFAVVMCRPFAASLCILHNNFAPKSAEMEQTGDHVLKQGAS
nr:PREDICTED: G-protein coupled receptor 56-like [Latimeria chalumnae]|eukprot:XP_014352780.1 PREDICTED: G-protein coupled receptor 56-like [Latimeria chalumnae]